MTDRELLELAAKAAGFKWSSVFGCGRLPGGLVLMPQRIEWNPLLDDGDALRLVVRLRMRVDAYDDQVETMDGCGPYKIGTEKFTNTFVCIELPGADHYAATRRAIVRAAAELGRAML